MVNFKSAYLPAVVCLTVSLGAFASLAREWPPIPEKAGLGVASVSLSFAMVCDLQFNRPALVRDAKALFLKFAKKRFNDPEVATERAYAYMRSQVTRQRLGEYHKQTEESCAELSRMFRRELSH